MPKITNKTHHEITNLKASAALCKGIYLYFYKTIAFLEKLGVPYLSTLSTALMLLLRRL